VTADSSAGSGRKGPSPAGSAEDAAAVEAAARGDRAGHRALYDRHVAAVRRLARGFASLDPDDVEDVVQDAFVRAFQNLGKLEEPGRFGPWVLAIARNRALSRLARRRAGAELAEELTRAAEALAEAETGLPDPGAEAELEVVRRVIAELPDGPEKETVRLFYVEGELSAREIAARLGVGKSAITMRLERFRAKVKRRILAEVARLRGEES
jgi:RNA polymerase sigma-70 factor (ECF subfamily)